MNQILTGERSLILLGGVAGGFFVGKGVDLVGKKLTFTDDTIVKIKYLAWTLIGFGTCYVCVKGLPKIDALNFRRKKDFNSLNSQNNLPLQIPNTVESLPVVDSTNIYANHWLYHYIPHHRNELSQKNCVQKIMWAVFGNDDDGIFGEGPKSGEKWTTKWGGKKIQKGNCHDPGEITFLRFLMWQLRNPLHNFSAYIVGFKGEQNIHYTQYLHISTQEISFYKNLPKVDVFPMRDHSGIYFGIHNKRPFISYRVNLLGLRWLEGYAGWRPLGGLGLALRLKKTIKI